MDKGYKLILFYWLKEKNRAKELVSALRGMETVQEVCSITVGKPSPIVDHIMDASYDVVAVITFANVEDFEIIFKSTEHQNVGIICKEIVADVKGYTVEF